MDRKYRVGSLAIVLFGFLTILIFFNKKNNSIKSKENEKILVGYPPVSTSLPLFVAIEEKLFEKRGIVVEPVRFETANQIVEALVTNRISGTSASADYPFFLMATKDKNAFKIFAWEMLDTIIPFDVIVARKGAGIKTLSDLKGKKIATFPGTQLKHYLKLILKNALKIEIECEIIEMPAGNQIPALASGAVDALFSLEPIITISLKKGISEVLVSSPISRYIGNGKPIPAASFAVSQKFISDKPDNAQKFIDAMSEAISLINKDQLKYRNLYPKFTAISPELAEVIPITYFKTLSDMDIELFQKEADILFEAKLLEKKLNVKDFIYK